MVVHQNKPVEWENHNGTAVRSTVVVATDAPLQGWGAVCKSTQTGGPWYQTEREHHINYLELFGAMLVVKAFTQDQESIHVHLRMDSKTAIFYVNRIGGTRTVMLSL